ncbi:MAG: hypothetical protein ACK5C6_08010 [Roseiflexaceae bacterium]|jgi:hypothetical protein
MNRVWRIGGMRIVREWWYALVVMVLLCSYAALYSDTKQWHIAIGASPVRSFGTELGVREQYTFLGADTWFRQIPNGSDIGVPVLAAPRIVRIRIITRSEDAPTQIQLVSARIRVPLTMPGQLRRYTLYIPAYQQLQITCDTSSVRSAYLQQFCAAIVDVRGYQPLPLQSTRLWWVMMLPISLWLGAAVLVGQRLRTSAIIRVGLLGLAGIIAWYALAHYPLQMLSWANGISLWLVGMMGVFWFASHPRFADAWIWGMIVLAVALRIMVYSAPGADGVDRMLHARQLEHVIYGDIYLEYTDNNDADRATPRYVATYPYPPAVYLLLAPFMLILSPVMTFNYYVGAMALLVDATLALALVRLMLHLGFGRHVATHSAFVLLFFPQAYVVHRYPWVAHALAQSASWWFVLMTIIAGDRATLRQRIIQGIFAVVAITGHVGAFLIMSVMQGFQWVLGRMRHAAWVWIVVAIGMITLYYSQYLVLMADQRETVLQRITPMRLDALYTLWIAGIDDHYRWIILVIGLLGVALPRVTTRPELHITVIAGIATTTMLALVSTVWYIHPTLILIFIAPLMAVGVGVMTTALQRYRAGHVLVMTVFAYFAYISLTTWMTFTIEQQLVRWMLPQ